MATFTLTCIGDDRPGLVSALSAPIHAHGGSWERSQMARLAGKFAGVLLVEVADERAEALVADLTALKDVGLEVLLERTDMPAEHPSLRLSLELLGADHPGIVAEISAALAAQRDRHRGAQHRCPRGADGRRDALRGAGGARGAA